MIEVDELLNPISDDVPTGRNLRWVDGDTTFSTIEDNRVDEDPALVFEGDPKTADWRLVISTAEDALREKTKDLQLVAWLTEGLCQLHGFDGLAAGFQLSHRMLDTFWDTIYPGFDDDEVELATRAKPLGWLTSPRGFLPSVKDIPIASKEHRWSDFERALQIEQARPQEAEEMLAAGGTNRASWIQTLKSMGPDGVSKVVDSVSNAENELETLIEVCNRRFGYDDSPLLTPLQDLLEEMRVAIEPYGRQPESAADGVASEAGEGREFGGGMGQAGSATGAIASRQDALQRLASVARFFRETEPHSPMAFLIERAVRWGNMSFQQLFSEVVKNDSALAQVWETLGIDPNAPDTGSPESPPGAPGADFPPAAGGTTSQNNSTSDDDW